jgi:NADH-quinone oxidoreductase subunit L
MEGPTPVSALIHAATMVTAGVYLVVRAFPLFAEAPAVLTVIAWVGAFTALLAATMACVAADIKRVLAYSTVSQLGFMLAAVGAGSPGAGLLHLLTHGLFKALLFLAAGAVIHTLGTNDIFRMGGLWRALPQTGITFVLGALALAGVWPLAGFFSKEAVLAAVWEHGLTVPFGLLVVTALLTAFYVFRVVAVAFLGPAPAEGHPHDAPLLMAVPLWVLAGLTVAVGIRLAGASGETHPPPGWLAALSQGLSGTGICLALATYRWGVVSPTTLSRLLGPLDGMARRGYGVDAAFAGLYRGALLTLSRAVGWLDRYVVDGLLNVISVATLRAGDQLRRMQTGQAQDYVYGVAFGFVLLIIASRLLR